MSGEATPRTAAPGEPLDRAFGPHAVCNLCAHQAEPYRVIALFLHDTVALRAYCAACHPIAVEGEYHAAGAGAMLTYQEFADRFGAPGPPPPPVTPVDRMLAALMRHPEVRSLVPASEAVARRRRMDPYRFRIEIESLGRADLVLDTSGAILKIQGEPAACERVCAILPATA